MGKPSQRTNNLCFICRITWFRSHMVPKKKCGRRFSQLSNCTWHEKTIQHIIPKNRSEIGKHLIVLLQTEVFHKEFWIPRLSKKIQICENLIIAKIGLNVHLAEISTFKKIHRDENILKDYTSDSRFWGLRSFLLWIYTIYKLQIPFLRNVLNMNL